MADRHHTVGLIGAGIQASLSPALHEAEADAQGLSYSYRLLDVERLQQPVGALVAQARREGFSGLNVTHPCKREVIEHLDELAPEAAALDAVNTVVFRDGRAIGHNTDASGFAESFRRGLPDAALGSVVVIGAGGAGAAVAHAVRELGAERVVVTDVDAARAHALAERLNAAGAPATPMERRAAGAPATPVERRAAGDPATPVERRAAGDRAPAPARRERPGSFEAGGLGALEHADGLIHATPTGMAAHPGLPLPKDLLHPDLWVAEVVYRPLETELLRRARELGCRALDGGGMAVFQAAGSFELFTGVAPDRERMLRDFEHLAEPVGASG